MRHLSAVFLLFCVLLMGRATTPAAETRPDILGIALGMPLSEVEQKIKAANPAFTIRALKDRSGTIGGYDARIEDKSAMRMHGPRIDEQIVVLGGRNNTVTTVARGQYLPDDKALVAETLEAALREKYGAPSLPRTRQWDSIMVWARNRSGEIQTDLSSYMTLPKQDPQQQSSWRGFSFSRAEQASMLAPQKLPQDGGTLIIACFRLGSSDGENINMRVRAFAVTLFDIAALYDDAAADRADRERHEREQFEKARANKPVL